MSEKYLGPEKVQKERDPDLAAAEVAMKRAAKKAQLKASRLGTGVVVWKDGRVVEERKNVAAQD